MKIATLKCMAAGLSLCLLTACAVNPVTGQRDLVLMSEAQEISLGQQSHQSVMRQYTPYDNPPLQSLVEELGQKLGRQSHRPNLNYQFSLLDSPQVNAFALPGGYIYITRGIIAYMNSEEELAGVLGHELGHVTARHGVRQHTSQTLAGLSTVALAAATKSDQIGQLSNQLGTAIVRGYGRSHELEADRLGAQYLARTGYDPEKMIEVVGILKDQEQYELARAREEGRQPRIYHGLFSTHPRNDDRLQTVIRAANELRVPNATPTNKEDFLRLLDGMVFGSSEKEGMVRDNQFFHKPFDLGLTYPNGWKLQNDPTQLVAFNQSQDQVIIVKGGQEAKGMSARDFLQKIAPKATNVQTYGRDGAVGQVAAQTPFGNQTIPIMVMPHKGRMFVFNAFGKNGPPMQQLQQVANSKRPLNAQERKLASEKRIKIIRAKAGDTFEALAARTSIEKYPVEQLRLLNGQYPNGQPTAGQLVKIVQ